MHALHDHIAKEIQQGKRKEDIYLELLGKGHAVSAIESAWKAAHARESSISGVVVMLILGAVLVGVGILSFVASNWEAMSHALRIVIILVAMVASYTGGWMVMQRGHSATGRALVLLGTIIYGAGIMLVGQMYHVQTHWINAFNLWLIGALAMMAFFTSISHGVLACLIPIAGGVVYGSSLMLRALRNEEFASWLDYNSWTTASITAVASVALWVSAWYLWRTLSGHRASLEPISSRAKKWLGRIAQLLVVYAVGNSTQALIMLAVLMGGTPTMTEQVVGAMMVLVHLFVAYWMRGRIVLFFGVASLIGWWETSIIAVENASQLVAPHAHIGLVLLTLVALLVVGGLHRMYPAFRHFGAMFIGPALTVLLILLIVTSSSGVIMSVWDNYGDQASVLTSWSMTFTYFVLITLVVGLLFVLARLRVLSRVEWIGLGVLTLFSLVVGTAGFRVVQEAANAQTFMYRDPVFTTGGIVWSFMMNIITFATMIWVAIVGYQRRDRWRVSTAAAAIIIWVLARYFDWIFTYLNKSIGFISLGVVLLVVGYMLERGRKRIIASFTHHHSA